MGTRATGGTNDPGVVADTFDVSGLADGWRFKSAVTSGRFFVDIPKNEWRGKARKAYKARRKTQPPGDWPGEELVPSYLSLRFNGKRAVLRTKLIDGGEGDLRVPEHVFKVSTGEVVLARGTVWGYRRYRLARPPAVYALAGLALGLAAAVVNVSLAIGKSLSPPPIVISDTWVAVWQAIAAVCSCAAVVVIFWSANIWEAEG